MKVWGIIRVQALAFIAVLALVQGCGYEERLRIEELIPTEEEMSYWTYHTTPAFVSDDQGLYAQINGAADKYLERGWVECVFLQYYNESNTLNLGIHDMGEDANALAILEYDMPIEYTVLWDGGDSSAYLDNGLPSAYAIKMRLNRFYVELSIDGKDRQSEQLITEVAELIRDRK